MRHDVGIMREKRPKNKIYIRPRLRIHGSTDILEHLNEFMFEELDIKRKSCRLMEKYQKQKRYISNHIKILRIFLYDRSFRNIRNVVFI